jgi:hypothetical protein
MSSDDRITDPDMRSPYEHVLGELNEIKALCRDTNARLESHEIRQWYALAASAAAFILAACSFGHG